MTDIHYPVYAGKRNVSLGAMRREYIPLVMEGINDLSVTRGVLTRPPVTLEMEYAWYDNAFTKQSDSDNAFAILRHTDKPEGRTYEYIGHTGLHRMNFPSAFGSTGSLIVKKDALGKGYGTEAKMLLLYHAFRVKGLRKVISEVKAFNGNSWGHLLKCGYEVIGRRKDHHFSDGAYVDEVVLEVFRETWEPLWERYQKSGELPMLTKKQRTLIARS